MVQTMVGTRITLLVLLGLFVRCSYCLAHGAPGEPSHTRDGVRKDMRDYHDQFMAHVETSLSRLNDSLHDWKDHGLSHLRLGEVAKHGVEVLNTLESAVSSAAMDGLSSRRRLHQIYDEASQAAAAERLAGAQAKAEGRLQEAMELLQDAAYKAVQNNTEDLVATLAERLTQNNIVSPGKAISDQLRSLELVSQVEELARGIVPEFNGGMNLFDGSLLNRLRPNRQDKNDGGQTLAGAQDPPEDVEDDVVVSDSDGDIAFNSTMDGPLGVPIQVSENVQVTPLQREGDGSADDAQYVPLLDNEDTRADFYKEKNDVFDRFDDQASGQGIVARRALLSGAGTLSIDADALIQRVDSSLEAFRAMKSRGITVSKETADAVKLRATEARERYQSIVSDAVQGKGRRLSSADSAGSLAKDARSDVIVTSLDVDTFVDSVAGEGDQGDDGYLTFPGEPIVSEFDRIRKEADGVVDGDEGPNMDYTSMFPMMPFMPVGMMSQEINFVFVPLANATDAEELVQSVVDTVIATLAESSMMPMMPYDFDTAMFDAYDPDQEVADSAATRGVLGPLDPYSGISSYKEVESASQRRRRRLKSSVQSMNNLMDDLYEIEVYVYDPVWFSTAHASHLVENAEEEDDVMAISLAIRLAGPEDLGGLPPDVLRFIAESDALMEEFMPRLPMFDAPALSRQQPSSSDAIADKIVQKLKSTYMQPSSSQGMYGREYLGSEFDLRWLGVMFGAVGIVLIVAIGSITAIQSKNKTPPGYVILEDIQGAKVISQSKPAAGRRTSNLPA
jgi:hypothetical protein